ncbi:type I restriction-modification system subunit M N-terminal domain-containing protein [Microcoleus sp. LAD1_D5]|uniref:type I restriction-modification system subunit M N-terminal domain-containing protein n=1 Tax=unclassified Microcoleus TaxID=2642155 RepID=UPI002FD0D66E
MPKRTTSQTNKPVTTAQPLESVIKSAPDIMRKEKGMNGELDRLAQFTGILFLKLLDDVEKVREEKAFL